MGTHLTDSTASAFGYLLSSPTFAALGAEHEDEAGSRTHLLSSFLHITTPQLSLTGTATHRMFAFNIITAIGSFPDLLL